MNNTNIKKDIPIDIQYSKLLEWLIDRKKVPPKWHDYIRKKDSLLPAAIESAVFVNVHDLKIAKQDVITYYEFKYLFQVLETAEGPSAKNMFGQYNSTILKNWNLLLKTWEKDNSYLGESSRLLIQWVSHECPALKKIVVSAEKQIADNNRRIQEYEKGIATSEWLRQEVCKEWGIVGTDDNKLRNELMELTNELPNRFDEIEKAINTVPFKSAVDYFISFTTFLFGKELVPRNSLISLQALLRGDRMRVNKQEPYPSSEATDTTISWDDSSATVDLNIDSLSGEVNWDLSIPTTTATDLTSFSASAQDNIDYGVVDLNWDITTPSAAAEISWDIESVAVDGFQVVETIETTVDSIPTDKVISPNENENANKEKTAGEELDIISKEEYLRSSQSVSTQSLLMITRFREDILDNLEELRMFLLQRLAETVAGEHLHLASLGITGVGDLFARTAEEVRGFVGEVEAIQDRFAEGRLRQLILLKEKKGSLDRAVKSITCHTEKANKLLNLAIDARSKKAESLATIAELNPRIQQLRDRTRTLKENLEKSLSQLLQGREIHIVGEINTM